MSWALLREAEADDTLGRRQLGSKVVLMYLARRANDLGVVKIGARIIAEDTGTDHRRVRRLLDRLCDMGRIDLVERGRNGRGHAHTWRVLSMAEWLDRKARMAREEEARKGGVESAFPDDRKGGVEATEKGATSPPPEQSPTPPPLPPAERGESDHRTETQGPATPSLPGLGRGEEGMPAIGRGSRAAGTNRRALARRQQHEADRQARQERDARIEAARRQHEQEEAERESTREERIAAARAVRERVRSLPRAAAGGR